MTRTLASLAACAAVAVPLAAHAATSDTDYCNALSARYREYVGANRASGDVPEAIAGCATNPTSSIPVLERALKDHKVDLPKRD